MNAGARAVADAAVELGEADVHAVVDGQHRQADDALGRRALELLEHPVVVGAHARERELAVVLDVA